MKSQNSRTNLSAIIFIPIAVLLLLGGGIFWFLANFEKKEFEERSYMSPAAYSNPYLAATRYLEKTGYEAEAVRGLGLLTELPSTNDTIFIARMPSGLRHKLRDSLLDWVNKGGHLMFLPGQNDNSNPNLPSFSSRIGFTPILDTVSEEECGCSEEEEDGLVEESEHAERTGQETGDNESDKGQNEVEDTDDGYHPFERVIHIEAGDYQLSIERNGYLSLEDTSKTASYSIPADYILEYTEEKDLTRNDNYQLVEAENDWLLRYDIGRGKITVLSDTRFLTNNLLSERDHAFFLSYLIGRSEKVWIIYSSNVDSLFKTSWHSFPLFWISLALMALSALWRYQVRIGPLKTIDNKENGSILAHIDASAAYHWRIDNCRSIVETNRRYFMQLWNRRNQGTESEQDLEKLTLRTGLTNQEVLDALQSSHKSEQEFIRSSRAMQKFYLALQDGDKKRHD